MRESAILRALSELDRWKRRREELRGRKDLRAELDAVERQIAYYQALAEDMKREVRPARTGDLLSAIFR
jgi:hypothetical protein